MEPQNQPTNPNPQSTMEPAKKCKHMPIIIILAILAIGGLSFGGFELWQNIQKNSQLSETDDRENIITDSDEKPSSIVTGNALFIIGNTDVISDADNVDIGICSESGEATAKFEYGFLKNILSTYSIVYSECMPNNVVSKIISNNIDSDTGERLNNEKVLGRFGITMEEAYRNILENLADSVSAKAFLLDAEGSVDAEQISINDFKKNIDTYIETLRNDQENFYVFLKESKIAIAYSQREILEKLGMSSHMDAGLIGGYTEIKL